MRRGSSSSSMSGAGGAAPTGISASSASAGDEKALIAYLLREGLYGSAGCEITAQIRRRGNDPVLLFWKAFAVGMQGDAADVLRDFEALRGKRDVELAAIAALLFFHRRARAVDDDAVEALEAARAIAEGNANETGALLAARFDWMVGDVATARPLVSRVLGGATGPETPAMATALFLRGRIELPRGVPTDRAGLEQRRAAVRCLDTCGLDRDPEVLLTRSEAAAGGSGAAAATDAALEHLNRAVALHPWFWPALVERGKLFAAAGDWEQAEESLQRALATASSGSGGKAAVAAAATDGCVSALRLLALCAVLRGAEPSVTGELSRRLAAALASCEPRNAAAFRDAPRAIARACGRAPEVLQPCVGMAERAVNLSPGNATCLAEFGRLAALAGDFGGAAAAFRKAARADETAPAPLLGLVYCQVQEGQLEDAAQQLELLLAVHDGGSGGAGAETEAAAAAAAARLAFLRALLAWRRDRSPDAHLAALQESCRAHDAVCAAADTLGPHLWEERVAASDPDFMAELAAEYLLHSDALGGLGGEPGRNGKSSSRGGRQAAPSAWVATSPRDKGISLLEACVELVPGLAPARLQIARAKLAAGDSAAAGRALQQLLTLRPAHSGAHLLAARLALAGSGGGGADRKAAARSLEQALSCDFGVRAVPSYYLLRAEVAGGDGDWESARKALEEALRLPGVRDRLSAGGPPDAERAAVFVGLVGALAQLKLFAEAQELAEEARGAFRGGAEEVAVLVADCELQVARGEIDGALAALAGVPRVSASYSAAQTVRASVLLRHRRDKAGFVQCYRDVAAAEASPRAYAALGEAYLRIQMPEAAIEAFEAAASAANAGGAADQGLAAKIGRALIATHDYRRAMEFYTRAVRDAPGNAALRHDLARLCTKLGRHDEALAVLEVSAGGGEGGSRAGSGRAGSSSGGGGGRRGSAAASEDLEQRVQTLLLIAEARRAAGDHNRAAEALQDARAAQQSRLERAKGEGGAAVAEQSARLAQVIRHAAKAAADGPPVDDTLAVRLYKKALAVDSGDEPSLEAVARAHLRRGELDACQERCEALLRLREGHEGASLMLAEVLLRRGEPAQAMRRYQRLLIARPNNYDALAELIMLFVRAGRTADVPLFLRLADAGDSRAAAHAGAHYCKGLYRRHTNDVADALRHFNAARRDGRWGQRALRQMIWLYLYPDNEAPWEAGAGGNEATENVRVAEKLLKELKAMDKGGGGYGGNGGGNGSNGPGKGASAETRVLEGYVLMASRRKEGLDSAMSLFIELLEERKDHLPALLGMSTAFMLEGAPNKARNALKRIAKMPHTTDLSDEFELSYLLLAELYVERGKYDLAQELCKRCLSYNKSCSRAWSAMGLIMEKEQSYRDAADCYERSWSLDRSAGAAVGFKLAFNYLKADRHVDAIDVCNAVLARYPDYPKIREEVLAKAHAALRP